MSFFFWPQQAGSNFLGFGRSRPEATFLLLAAAGRKQPFWFCPQLAGSNFLGFGRSRPKATYVVLAAAGRKRFFFVSAAAVRKQPFWLWPQHSTFWFWPQQARYNFFGFARSFSAAAGRKRLFWFSAAAGWMQLFWLEPEQAGAKLECHSDSYVVIKNLRYHFSLTRETSLRTRRWGSWSCRGIIWRRQSRCSTR